jgi:hypothetical protein
MVGGHQGDPLVLRRGPVPVVAPAQLADGEVGAQQRLRANAPKATMTRGFTSSTWRRRYGLHASTSSGCGLRFIGGRHLSTLQT